MRRYLNEKGMAVVTLKYRTPRPEGLAKHTTAWQDLQRAIRIVRNQAAEKGLDHQTTLLPARCLAGNRQLHLYGPHLGVSYSERIQ